MFKRTASKILLCLALVLSLFLSINYIPSANIGFALDLKSLNITNGNFTDISSHEPADIPNGWTAISGTGADSAISGVIDVSAEGFETKYKTENPRIGSGNDNKVLMINGNGKPSNKGYKTDTLSFEPSAFYMFSIWAKTLNNGIFSIYLIEETTDETGKDMEIVLEIFELGNTDWHEYSFFIESHSVKTTNVHLELWLGQRGSNKPGSSGSVFFDSVTLKQLNSVKYDEYYNLTSSGQKKVVNLKNSRTILDSGSAEYNFGFENITGEAVEGFEEIEKRGDIQILKQDYLSSFMYNNILTGLKPHGFYNNNEISTLLLTTGSNTRRGYAKLESKEITIKQQERYMLSIIAKSNAANVASIEVETVSFYKNGNEVNKNAERPTAVQTIAESSAVSESINNGWQKYNFMINGNPNYDTNIKLNILFASPDSLSSGYAAFDDIVLEKLTKEEIDAGLNLPNSTTLNLYTSNSGTVSNGSFDYADYIEWSGAELQNGEVIYPIAPVSNWKHNEIPKEKKQFFDYGIIDTSATHFDPTHPNYKNYSFANPGTLPHQQGLIDSTNNVLMLKNNASLLSQSFTSDSFSLSADVYLKISGYINRPYSSGKAYAQIQDSDVILAKIEVTETSGWENFEFIIKTNFTSKSLTITLGLEDAYGVVFFDNIDVSILSNMTEEQFKTTANTFLTKKLDLSYDTFNQLTSLTSNDGYNLYSAPQFNKSLGELAKFGILDLNNIPGDMKPIGETYNNVSNNLLYLYHTVKTASTFSLKDTYYLNEGEYYRISIVLNTRGIDNDNPFERTSGLNISLSGINAEIRNIKSFSGYKEYTFYIKATETAETNLTFSFGSDSNKASGEIFIRYILAERIDIDKYTEATNSPVTVNKTEYSMAKYNIIIGNTEAKTEEPDITNPTDPSETNEFPWVIIPTLILGLALLLVIIKVTMDNLHIFKREPKPAGITDYDKNYENRKPTLRDRLIKIALPDEETEDEFEASTKSDKKTSKFVNFIKKIILPDTDNKKR